MEVKAKVFHYKILETKPISALEEFKDHDRLQVFFHKGCKCVKCGKEATQIALGEGRGQHHWDLYTDDFYPLTVDHIIPKSRGGSDLLENKQPMCAECNSRKGSKLEGELKDPFDGIYSVLGHICKWPRKQNRYYEKFIPKIGDNVYKKDGYTFKYLGKVSEFVINPCTGRKSFMLEGNLRSMYDIKVAYKFKNNEF